MRGVESATKKKLAQVMRLNGWITVAEAARLGIVPAATVYTWVRTGVLPFQRVGPRKLFVSLTKLREMLPTMRG